MHWVTKIIKLLLYSPLPVAALDLNMPKYDANDYSDIKPHYSSNQQSMNRDVHQLRKMRAKLPVVEEPELIEWINILGRRLENQIGLHKKLSFFIINDQSINAFATPYGGIFINTGLILHTKTESELAAVIAHEIAHISQQHIQRIMQKDKKQWIETGVMVAAGLAASSQDKKIGNVMMGAAFASGVHRQLSFSRKMEIEADRVGIKILASAGFNVHAMPRYLEKLGYLSSNRFGNMTQFLRSHPLSSYRVSETRMRANKYPKKVKNTLMFEYMREKIRSHYYENGSENSSDSLNQLVKNYSQAQYYLKLGKLSLGVKLLPIKASHLSEALLKVALLNKMKRYDKSIKILSQWKSRSSTNILYTLLLAEAYLGNQREKKAWNTINQTPMSEQTSIHFFEKKQQIASILKKPTLMYMAIANQMKRLGKYHHANYQYKRIIASKKASQSIKMKAQLALNQLSKK